MHVFDKDHKFYPNTTFYQHNEDTYRKTKKYKHQITIFNQSKKFFKQFKKSDFSQKVSKFKNLKNQSYILMILNLLDIDNPNS